MFKIDMQQFVSIGFSFLLKRDTVISNRKHAHYNSQKDDKAS